MDGRGVEETRVVMTSLVPPGSLYLAGGGQKEKGDVGVG